VNKIATGGTERNAFYNGREKNRLEREKEQPSSPDDALFPLLLSPPCDVIPRAAAL